MGGDDKDTVIRACGMSDFPLQRQNTHLALQASKLFTLTRLRVLFYRPFS